MTGRDIAKSKTVIIDVTLRQEKRRLEYIGFFAAKITAILDEVEPAGLEKACEHITAIAEGYAKTWQKNKALNRANGNRASR